MKKPSPLNYAFAIGKIRALEKFLIRQEVFAEAIEADLAAALRLFAEPGLYSDELLQIKDSQDLEAILTRELQKLRALLQSLLLDKDLIKWIELDALAWAKNILKELSFSNFLRDYSRHLIDMHNIKTFLRLYVLKEPLDKLNAHLEAGGFIQKELFLKLYHQDISLFLHRLEYVHKDSAMVDYASFLREAIMQLEKTGSFVWLEKANNDFLVAVLKPAKYISFGSEPLLAYYFAKLNEMNLIRMIILGKLNAISPDLVKERLNAVYA